MKETTVIKAGGALLSDADAVDRIWSAVARMRETRRVVLVHGGGPRATEIARRLGHEPRVIRGRRVTGDLDLQIVKWTMRGELNVNLVAEAAAHGVRAVGVSGVDGRTLRVVRRPQWNVDGERVDFGWVGDVEHVETTMLDYLLDGGFVPVIAPLGIDAEGRIYNVNADTVSCALAAAIGADEYLLVTESGGVRLDANDATSHLSTIGLREYEEGTANGWIADGMIVKLKVAFDALIAGVSKVYIVAPGGILDRTQGTRVIE